MRRITTPLLWFLAGGTATLLAGLVSGATRAGALIPRPGELARMEATLSTPWPIRLQAITWHPDTPEAPQCHPCCEATP